MRTLILASESRQIFSALFSIVPALKAPRNVAYIWTAAKAEANYEEWLEEDRARMRGFGWMMRDVDLEGMNEAGVREALAGCDLIYVQGGNTFFLLKCMKESGFDRVTGAKLEEPDVIYMGCSAGSIVAGANIATAGWLKMDRNDYGLTDLTGLGFRAEMIYPHVTPEKAEAVAPLRAQASCPTVLLSDDQFLLEQDGVARVVNSDLSSTTL